MLADFSNIYDMTLNKRLDYLKDLRMQGVDASDIRNFGSVLVLIPHLCKVSEEAIDEMKRCSVDDSPSSQVPKQHVPEKPSANRTEDHSPARDPTNNDVVDMFTKLAKEMAEVKESNVTLARKIDEQSKLLKQTEEIKGRLTAVFNSLEEMRKALERRAKETPALEARVNGLKEKVANLLVRDINVTTLMEDTKEIENEIVELMKEQPQDGEVNINGSLQEMNGQLHQVQEILLKLSRDSHDQQRLSDAIEIVKKDFGSMDCTPFAKKLGFSDREIKKIRCFAPGYIVPQTSELLRLWREKNGSNATLEALEQACRNSGYPKLADKISKTCGATSAGVSEYFFYIKEKVGSDWEVLALILEFDRAEIENIAGRNRDDKSRCMDTLECWQRTQGVAATIEVLIGAMSKAGLQDVVDGLKIKFPEVADIKDADGLVGTDTSKSQAASGARPKKTK